MAANCFQTNCCSLVPVSTIPEGRVPIHSYNNLYHEVWA